MLRLSSLPQHKPTLSQEIDEASLMHRAEIAAKMRDIPGHLHQPVLKEIEDRYRAIYDIITRKYIPGYKGMNDPEQDILPFSSSDDLPPAA